MPTTNQVKVIQADREAAADVYRRFRYGTDSLKENLLAGKCDADPITQAFARHRLSHLPQGEGEVRELLAAAWWAGGHRTEAIRIRSGSPFMLPENQRILDALSHPVSSVSREDVLEEAARVADGHRCEVIGIPSAAADDCAKWIAERIRALKSSTPSVSEGEGKHDADPA